jgi:hypothetical protein
MGARHTILFTAFFAPAFAMNVAAAELPSQNKKPKAPEAAKHCNVAGSPGIVAADGVCVKLGGYISADFNGRQIK